MADTLSVTYTCLCGLPWPNTLRGYQVMKKHMVEQFKLPESKCGADEEFVEFITGLSHSLMLDAYRLLHDRDNDTPVPWEPHSNSISQECPGVSGVSPRARTGQVVEQLMPLIG